MKRSSLASASGISATSRIAADASVTHILEPHRESNRIPQDRLSGVIFTSRLNPSSKLRRQCQRLDEGCGWGDTTHLAFMPVSSFETFIVSFMMLRHHQLARMRTVGLVLTSPGRQRRVLCSECPCRCRWRSRAATDRAPHRQRRSCCKPSGRVEAKGDRLASPRREDLVGGVTCLVQMSVVDERWRSAPSVRRQTWCGLTRAYSCVITPLTES